MADMQLPLKTARKTAERDHFANGTLEVLSASDTVLAIFSLTASGGTVTDDIWTMAFDATTVQGEVGATGTGTDAAKAQLKTAGGSADYTGFTVGPESTAWAGSTAVALGQVQANGGNLYQVTTAGTTAASGGPSGTGTGITDGTAVWDYLMPVPDFALDNVSIASGQDVTITGGQTQHAA